MFDFTQLDSQMIAQFWIYFIGSFAIGVFVGWVVTKAFLKREKNNLQQRLELADEREKQLSEKATQLFEKEKQLENEKQTVDQFKEKMSDNEEYWMNRFLTESKDDGDMI